MKKIAVLFSVAAALAVSAPVVAQARHSADDPSVELRHRADDRGRVKSVHRISRTASTVQTRTAGSDDSAGDDRGGHGGDDGPHHR